LYAISRFGTVELGGWTIDLEELGVDWTAAQPKSEAKLAYSLQVVEILDRAAVLSKLEGAGKIGVDHLLVCFAKETGGVMGALRERYGIDSVRWRAAVAHLAGAGETETAGEPAPPREPSPVREYLSPEEAAEFLGVHVQTLRGYIRSGKLPALRVAGERVIRIHRGSLESLLEPLTLEPTA
jgi:excisionase family DNA binding protein